MICQRKETEQRSGELKGALTKHILLNRLHCYIFVHFAVQFPFKREVWQKI